MYLPKSKYNIKETPGNELVVKATREPYAGSYLELSNGQYFAGNNIVNKGPELILISPSTDRRFDKLYNDLSVSVKRLKELDETINPNKDLLKNK